jgi:hypothetical protein
VPVPARHGVLAKGKIRKNRAPPCGQIPVTSKIFSILFSRTTCARDERRVDGFFRKNRAASPSYGGAWFFAP